MSRNAGSERQHPGSSPPGSTSPHILCPGAAIAALLPCVFLWGSLGASRGAAPALHRALTLSLLLLLLLLPGFIFSREGPAGSRHRAVLQWMGRGSCWLWGCSSPHLQHLLLC